MRRQVEFSRSLIAVLLVTALTGCSGDDAGRPGDADKPRGGLLEEVVSSIGEQGEGKGEAEETTVERVSEKNDGAESEDSVSETPSLIYTRKYFDYRVRKSADPFQPLLSEGQQLEGLSLNTLMLTGIMWEDRLGMVVMEDNKGRGYPLRVGDKLAGARLVAIREDAAVFRVVEFGVVHNVVKELFLRGERPI